MDFSEGINLIIRGVDALSSVYALERFRSGLGKHGVCQNEIRHYSQADARPVMVIGTASDRRVQLLLENNGIEYHREEAVFYQWCRAYGRDVLLIAGSDANGLMYALLELAERIECSGRDALRDVKNTAEYPENAVRCMDRYLLGPLDGEWMDSEEFWHFFLGRLAHGRYNRFCLIMGYDTPYMSPPYPYYVRTKGYEAVAVQGFGEDKMAENLRVLRRIGELCHQYGQKFFLATWQQRAVRVGQQSEIDGLDAVDLMGYCHEGIKALLLACPEIDGVQFRVNHESGVGSQITAEEFWNNCVDTVACVARQTGRKLIMDLRAKGLSDSIIDHALETGLHVEVATKFWCEHTALPYHLTVMRTEELTQLDNLNFSRRYSYADMLRKPAHYDVVYRLWNYGSTNLFLWGDGDHVRRFSRACSLGGIGYQVNNPLSLKGGFAPRQKAPWNVFADPTLRSGRWEEERFWLWYTLFGRLGYRADTNPEVWMRGFRSAFGERCAPVLERGLRYASKIIPLITAFHMPMHPSNTYWPELSTGWGLFSENNAGVKHRAVSYGSSEPSDVGMFYGVNEYAKAIESGSYAGKYSPLQVSDWLEDCATKALEAIRYADNAGDNSNNPEYLALKTDINMLALLARYHTQKIRAALALERHRLTGERSHLSDAYAYHLRSKTHWLALSALGKKAYHHDLEFSSGNTMTRHGTWEDLLPEILGDEKKLVELLGGFLAPVAPAHNYSAAPIPEELRSIRLRAPEEHPALSPLTIKVESPFCIPYPVTLHYRHSNQLEGHFMTMPLQGGADGYFAQIPAEYLVYDWDLLVYATVSVNGSAFVCPGLDHPESDAPYLVIRITKGE